MDIKQRGLKILNKLPKEIGDIILTNIFKNDVKKNHKNIINIFKLMLQNYNKYENMLVNARRFQVCSFVHYLIDFGTYYDGLIYKSNGENVKLINTYWHRDFINKHEKIFPLFTLSPKYSQTWQADDKYVTWSLLGDEKSKDFFGRYYKPSDE